MKVAEVARRRRSGLSPLKARVLEQLEAHADEVYGYRDEQLARGLGVKVSALSFTLWALHHDGLIDKEEVGGKVYFGSRAAIAELRKRLGQKEDDPFRRARLLREQIFRRTGNIDVIELLDAVRGRWE